MDSIEDKVCALIQERRKLSIPKYGTDMERTDLSELEWLQHAQEEAVDFAIYLEKLKTEACVLSKDDMIFLVALLTTCEDTFGTQEQATSIKKKLKDALNLDRA